MLNEEIKKNQLKKRYKKITQFNLNFNFFMKTIPLLEKKTLFS
jgi:hypothetical protein